MTGTGRGAASPQVRPPGTTKGSKHSGPNETADIELPGLVLA